jgi:ethanolamine utilization protein EutA (predicted chaperonin)
MKFNKFKFLPSMGAQGELSLSGVTIFLRGDFFSPMKNLPVLHQMIHGI